MSHRPFLKEATKLFDLLDEMKIKDNKIVMIEISLARVFDASYQEGWSDRGDNPHDE